MILICRRGDGEGGTTEYLPAPEVSHGAAYLCPLKENMELKKNFDFYSAWQTHCLKKKNRLGQSSSTRTKKSHFKLHEESQH